MLKRVLRRCVREPLTSLAAILFVAILSLIICFLHTSQEEELQNLTDTYYNTPITFEVCWLDGSRLYDSAPASGHFADLMPGLFLGNGRYKSNFIDLITDLQIRMTYFSTVGITSPEAANDQPAQFGEQYKMLFGCSQAVCTEALGTITVLGERENSFSPISGQVSGPFHKPTTVYSAVS